MRFRTVLQSRSSRHHCPHMSGCSTLFQCSKHVTCLNIALSHPTSTLFDASQHSVGMSAPVHTHDQSLSEPLFNYLWPYTPVGTSTFSADILLYHIQLQHCLMLLNVVSEHPHLFTHIHRYSLHHYSIIYGLISLSAHPLFQPTCYFITSNFNIF